MKKALLVGVNYTGSQFPLRGCINDIMAVNEVLVNHLGFDDPKQIRMLTEESATTANILERLEWLVKDAAPGDILYFHWSGHGSQFPNYEYDDVEPDGLDEIICPYDINFRDKMIKDDDFKRIFSTVPKGVNLTVVLDSCHSGQGLRDIMIPVEIRDTIYGPTRNRAMPVPADIANRSYGLNLDVKPRAIQDPNIIAIEDQTGMLISGCKSNQTSADAWIQPVQKFYGALTYNLLRILKEHDYNISYRRIVELLNNELPQQGFTQHPELNGRAELFDNLFLK